jgi:hypothetical protein
MLSIVDCTASADSLRIFYFGSVFGEVLVLFCSGLPAVALAKAGGVRSQQRISLSRELTLPITPIFFHSLSGNRIVITLKFPFPSLTGRYREFIAFERGAFW